MPMDLFFEVHRDLPREGPGEAASTRRAYQLMHRLPENPRLLDIGCGPGLQTLELARISAATVLAVDTHQPFLDVLARQATQAGLADRITTRNQSMNALDFEPGSFDVLWSEGAIYIIGFEKGLRKWQPLLKKGGYVAVTELTWLKAAPPAEAKAFWKEGYPGMQTLAGNLAAIQRAGYREIDHFVLPESAWWQDYYNPMDKRIAMLTEKYQGDAEALTFLRECRGEIEVYRRYSEWYGYVFYVMQK